MSTLNAPPNTVLAGEFTIFAKTGRVTVTAATTEISHTDFEGKYQLTPGRKLSFLEEQLVPKLAEWYIIPDQVVNICRHAQVTTGRPMQMRNFLMRGPAGTGKTQGAMAIAAVSTSLGPREAPGSTRKPAAFVVDS